MNTLIFVACFVALGSAFPVEESAPFHLKQSSDVDGSYSFTYSAEGSSRTETRLPNGSVRGAYSYVDDNGVIQKVQYVADEYGVQIYGSNLPVGSTVPVKETPEVLEATAQHFALVDQHLKKVVVAQRMEAQFRAAHPELFDKPHHVILHQTFATPARKVVFVPTHHFQQSHEEELPVAPEEDLDVQYERAAHLAEVERLTQEHFAALAAAPPQQD